MPNCDWTTEELRKWRSVADQPADDAVAEILALPDGRRQVNELWDHLLYNDQLVPANLPAPIRRYLEATGRIDEPVDEAQLARGAKFFMANGPFTLLGLLMGSLPECYVMRHGVQVLASTQRLEAHVTRRLFETAQMIVAVMSPGGLGGGGGGIRAAQKVRLMHAAIRHLLLREPEEFGEKGPQNYRDVLSGMAWDAETLGLPINQEDMAYTLLTFSYVIVRAVEILGIDVSIEDKNAYIYCWNVVGRYMGVRPELLPCDYYKAHELFQKIKRDQAGRCPQGEELTRALLQCERQTLFVAAPAVYLLTGWRLPKIVTREVVGDETADLLGIPRLHWGDQLTRLGAKFVFEIGSWFWEDLVKETNGYFGRRFVEVITRLPRKQWGRDLFDLPGELSTAWGIKN